MLAAAGILSGGCATKFTDPVGDTSSMATLVTSDGAIGILSIDGEVATSPSRVLWSGKGLPGKYYVAPGKHKVLAMLWGPETRFSLWIVTEPSKEYLLRGDFSNLWFQDLQTGRLVGGRAGSADEPPDKDGKP
jgi:hypothetical protein